MDVKTAPTPHHEPRPLLLASAIGLALTATAALGAERGPNPDVVVTGRATPLESASSKFTAPLLDTPKSVTVISQALIAETGSTSLVDALRTVPGITFNAGEGGQPAGDNLKIRGFDAGSDVFIDGVRDAGSQTRDVFALEQIEVVKGPSSAFSGRGSTGGSVNLVSKKPRTEQFLDTQVGAGTDGYGRVAIDANLPFGDSAAFRLNALRQDADVPGRDAVSTSHWGLAPSLAFGIGEATRVNVDWYRYATDDIPDYSIPYARNPANTAPQGEPVAVDRTNFYGLLARDFHRTSADVRTLSVGHDFGNGLTLTNTTRYGRTTNDYIVTNPDDGRGNIVNGFLYRSAKSRDSVSTTAANQTNVSGEARFGGLAHSFSFGMEASREEMTNQPYVVASAFNGNAVTAFASSCSAPGAVAASGYNCTTLANPDPNDPWVGTITRSPNLTATTADTRSAYGFDTLTFNPRWSLNLGARWDDYDTVQNGFASGVPQRLRNQADFWNYQAGVVFKPVSNGSIYLANGTSSSPSGNTLGDGTENLAANNADLEPERDRTLELGTKWSLGNRRLVVSSAIFRMETANARAATASGLLQNIGDEKVDGFEVGLSGNVTSKWQLFGSYSFLDSEIVDDGPLAANDGHEFPNTPRNSVSLWTSYTISPKVTVGGGATYVDERFGNVANTVSIPDYWRYDAMASFAVGERVSMQVNLNNLTDTVYFVRPYQNHYAALGPARSAVVSATLKF
jgi:catecholate siderophore receptor